MSLIVQTEAGGGKMQRVFHCTSVRDLDLVPRPRATGEEGKSGGRVITTAPHPTPSIAGFSARGKSAPVYSGINRRPRGTSHNIARLVPTPL